MESPTEPMQHEERPHALGALVAVSAVLAALIAYEAVRFRELRARVRSNPSATLAEMRGA